MASISAEDTRAVLVRANELAKIPENLSVGESWGARLSELVQDKCPKTYVVVTCILLAARAMHPQGSLNVLEIQRGDDPAGMGYSAPSIGSVLAAFAKEHHIDLRATSQQPMNNQPFTYKKFITQDMGVRPTLKPHWDSFFATANYVNNMSSSSALEFLAYIFANRKKITQETMFYEVGHVNWASLQEATAKISKFVDARSDSGKVGQAFASSLLDLLYSEDFVDQGNAQDPDAGIPGDVHVRGLSETIWLWVEVKQQPIQTGQVVGFMDKVSENHGERVLYLALKNGEYPSEISIRKVMEHAARKSLRITVFQSPEETIEWFLEYAPGTHAEIMGQLLSRMQARLVESGCSTSTLEEFEAIANGLTRG